jgi:polysaccharide export outer membrane protein
MRMVGLSGLTAALLATCLLSSPRAADAPTDYRVGPGDLLHIAVFGSPDLAGDARVSESGNITFPLLGAVPVAGLSTRDIETNISRRLTAGHFLKDAQVTALVVDYQSHRVAVLGEVAKPGQYPVVGTRRVLNLLADAGGVLTASAGDEAVLIHADGTRIPLDLVALTNGDASQNPVVGTDDTINVPKAAEFYIYGEVQKPGVYRLARHMTISEAISAGGGLTRRGTERRVLVKRHEADNREERLRLGDSDLLQPNDVVMVKQGWF